MSESMEERASYEAEIVRLKAENEKLMKEIDVLREEMGKPKIIRLKAIDLESGSEKE